MEPLAPHERVYVDPEFLADENHGELGCEACHGGDPAATTYEAAHAGVVRDPSYPDAMQVCGDCHDDIAARAGASLHVTLAGYDRVVKARATADPAAHATLAQAQARHCDSCHSSCGQCHVSRPASVGGGLLAAHVFARRPPVQQTCTACHGSRVKQEYFGDNEGAEPDVHRSKYMGCERCHGAAEMHGTEEAAPHRYAVANAPRCVDCHEAIYGTDADNADTHDTHRDLVTCQVCHAQPYKHCASCHVGTDESGLAYFKTARSWLDFRIGLNPLRSERHPETFALVRHVPVDRETFAFYGEGLLGNFDALPTWKFATPHTILRKTAQNAACDNCHGNAALFLREADVAAEERDANRAVIVPSERIPEPVE